MEINKMLDLLYAHKGKKTDEEFLQDIMDMMNGITDWVFEKFGIVLEYH